MMMLGVSDEISRICKSLSEKAAAAVGCLGDHPGAGELVPAVAQVEMASPKCDFLAMKLWYDQTPHFHLACCAFYHVG